ncbi:MAG: hypothetical protein ABSF93_21105 [Candidatus Sulfotelmatobacter sp.]|jgi:hypothetical protein
MSSDEVSGIVRAAGSGARPARGVPYTSKDFQLEVLGQLAEMHEMIEVLRESVANERGRTQEPGKRLPFDGRTLVAIAAIALSLTGYVLQDARNTSTRDSDIGTTKARVVNLERISEANTEGRIRAEVQLSELREGQSELKRMIEQHDSTSKPSAKRDQPRDKSHHD